MVKNTRNPIHRLLAGILCLVMALSIVATAGVTFDVSAADMVVPSQPAGNQLMIYVSPNGSDSANGTSAPVATVARALEIAKSKISSTNVTIDIANGTYPITSPITISNAYTNQNYVLTLQGHGSSVISGGVSVTGWQKHSGNIWKATVSGTNKVNGFYVDGENMTLARMQVSGSFVNENGGNGIVLNNGSSYSSFSNFPNNDRYASCAFTTSGSYSLNASAVSAAIDDIQMYFDQTFMRTKFHFSRVVYKNNKFTFYADQETMNAMAGAQMADYSSKHNSYYLTNSYLFLNEEGEYFYDKDTKTLYYYSATSPANRNCVVAASEGLLNIQGTSSKLATNVRLLDLTFAYGTSSIPFDRPYKQIQSDSYVFGSSGSSYERMPFPAQVTIDLASNLTISGCSFENLDTTGVAMRTYVYNSCIVDSSFKNVSGSGIAVGTFNMNDGYGISDSGSLPSDLKNVYSVSSSTSIIPAQLTFRNNLIENTGIESIASNGILVYYGYNVDIVNNTVDTCGGSGISVGWGWGNYTRKQACPKNCGNIYVDNNKIISPCLRVKDAGGIYTLGAFPGGSGCFIRNNFIDMTGAIASDVPAIYLDEGSEFITVSKNVSVNTPLWLSCRALPVSLVNNVAVVGSLKGNSIMNSSVTGNYADVALVRQYVYSTIVWPFASEVSGANVTIANNSADANWKNNSTIMAIVNAAGSNGVSSGSSSSSSGGSTGGTTNTSGSYIWDVTVNYTNGASGSLTFTNPGLDGWDAKYINQSVTVTPTNNTATLYAPDPSSWIVDNTATWYQWNVTNPNGYDIAYTVTSALTTDDYATHGKLTITVTGSGGTSGESVSAVGNTMTKENAQTIAASASDGSFNTYTTTIVNNTGAAFVDDLTFWFTAPSGWPSALYGENQKITFSQGGDVVSYYAHQYVAGYLKTGGWGGSWSSNATDLGYTFTVEATNDPNYAGNSTMTITVSGTANVPAATEPATEPTTGSEDSTATDYVWDVTVNYTNGASGSLTFTNPGLDGWDSKYINQSFTVTPTNNTAALHASDPSTWIVDNTKTWYQWNVTNPNGYDITYTVASAPTKDNYATHGKLTITVSGSGESVSAVGNTMTKENAQTIAASASDGSFNTYTTTIVNNTGAAFVDDLTFWFTAPSGWPSALYGENQKITFSQGGDVVSYYAHQYVAGYLKTGGWGGSWSSNATDLGYTFTVEATNDPNYAGNSTMTITVSGTAVSSGASSSESSGSSTDWSGSYVWDVTVNYTNGASGSLTFTNPGMDDWDEKYVNQSFTVTSANNTAKFYAFDPSSWIVNNSATWYQWTVTNPNGYKITYTVTTPLTKDDYNTHGQLTITVSK